MTSLSGTTTASLVSSGVAEAEELAEELDEMATGALASAAIPDGFSGASSTEQGGDGASTETAALGLDFAISENVLNTQIAMNSDQLANALSAQANQIGPEWDDSAATSSPVVTIGEVTITGTLPSEQLPQLTPTEEVQLDTAIQDAVLNTAIQEAAVGPQLTPTEELQLNAAIQEAVGPFDPNFLNSGAPLSINDVVGGTDWISLQTPSPAAAGPLGNEASGPAAAGSLETALINGITGAAVDLFRLIVAPSTLGGPPETQPPELLHFFGWLKSALRVDYPGGTPPASQKGMELLWGSVFNLALGSLGQLAEIAGASEIAEAGEITEAGANLPSLGPELPNSLQPLEEAEPTRWAFWTGGDPARIASEQYGLTLEQTRLGQAAANASKAMLRAGVPWDVVKQLVWEPASQAFAESASGIPAAFINKINPATVWSQVEFSALMNNPEVEQIWIKYISEVSSLTDEEEWFRMGDAWVDSAQFFLPTKP